MPLLIMWKWWISNFKHTPVAFSDSMVARPEQQPLGHVVSRGEGKQCAGATVQESS